MCTLDQNFLKVDSVKLYFILNNGITNKDKRIKQTKEKLNTNNQVVKTSNIRKRNNYNINNLKIIEEKEYIQNKQKQKKTNLEFFVNEIPRLNNLGNDGPDAKKIIIDAMEEFQQILKQIWKERCDKVIEWEVNNGITNKDKRIKQTKEKLNTNNQVVKTSNIRKRNNYNINNLKIIEEKEYIQNKQKQKKTNLEFFVNESFLNTNTYKGNNLYKIKIFSDGDMAISS
ncbi:hypothetical protein Glove_177g151 [Diversispora epigaea]|uniref:Uncharacterized protein n=1 Tax=Diversispora epigaea TaxID=1348612 RepID=A0A397IUK7_9GLOM|nr:hypothetical protein Glove_177g151 [Diversispora epigaea]